MKKILFIICLLIPAALLCQNSSKIIPGYLGKRWVIDYTLNFLPSITLINPGANSEYNSFRSGSTEFHVNTQHKFSVERVVGRKFSVVGTVLFSRSQADIDVSSSSVQDFIQVKSRGYIFTLRQYRKHLAPISKYFDYKIGYYSITPEDFDYSVDDFENGTTSGTISAGSTGDFYMGFGFGNSRVIADRVIFSLGFEVGLLLGGMFDTFDNSTQFRGIDTDSPNSLQNRDALHSSARERVFFESLANFTVRLGFMP